MNYEYVYAVEDIIVDNIQNDGNNKIKEFYYLYQYTDDIIDIPESDQYPGLANYVKTGILTEKEMESLLGGGMCENQIKP